MRQKTKNKGIAAVTTEQTCGDKKCPFHGRLNTRGRQFTGTVISTKMRRTVIIEFERLHFLKKYERYEKRKTILKAHNPDCINTKEGDIVSVMECRPLSKTKNFVIIRKLGAEKGFKEKMKARESAEIREKTIEAKTEAAQPT